VREALFNSEEEFRISDKYGIVKVDFIVQTHLQQFELFLVEIKETLFCKIVLEYITYLIH